MTSVLSIMSPLHIARIQSDAFKGTLSLVGQGKFVIITVSNYVYKVNEKGTMQS